MIEDIDDECSGAEYLAAWDDAFKKERAKGAARMVELDLSEAEIAAALTFARNMHAGQLAIIERTVLEQVSH